MAQSITKVLEDKELRESLIKKGFERCRKFTWKMCADKIKEAYIKVENEKP